MRRREQAEGWSRRYQANRAKLASGDPARVAEVVKDLQSLDAESALTAGERHQLEVAQALWRALHDQSPATATDRDHAVDVLMAVFAEGRLDQQEYGDRLARVRAARTVGDLTAAALDLGP